MDTQVWLIRIDRELCVCGKHSVSMLCVQHWTHHPLTSHLLLCSPVSEGHTHMSKPDILTPSCPVSYTSIPVDFIFLISLPFTLLSPCPPTLLIQAQMTETASTLSPLLGWLLVNTYVTPSRTFLYGQWAMSSLPDLLSTEAKLFIMAPRLSQSYPYVLL